MNSKHRKTLQSLFAMPISRNIPFRDVSALLVAEGCVIQQGDGSRIRFVHGKTLLTLHEPHPGKEIKEYQVKQVRDFLLTIGVQP